MLSRSEQVAMNGLHESLNVAPVAEMGFERAQVADVLAELYGLLEEYAPVWYTQEHHEKAESALRLVGRIPEEQPMGSKRRNGRVHHRSNL